MTTFDAVDGTDASMDQYEIQTSVNTAGHMVYATILAVTVEPRRTDTRLKPPKKTGWGAVFVISHWQSNDSLSVRIVK